MIQPHQDVDHSEESSVVERVECRGRAVFVHGAETEPENEDDGRVEDATG